MCIEWISPCNGAGLEEGSEEDRRPARRGLGSAGSLPQVAPSVHSNANDDGDDEIIQQRQHWAAVPNPATYVFGIILAARVRIFCMRSRHLQCIETCECRRA